MLGKIFKWIGIFLLVLAAIPALWFLAATIRGDDAPDPETKAFAQMDEDAWKQDNGNLAMLGLAAPASVEDSYAWALQLVAQDWQERQAEFPAGTDYTALYKALGEGGSLWKKIDEPDRVKFQGDARALGCWRSHGWDPSEKPAACTTREELAQRIHDNGLLMKRYQSALAHQRFIDFPQMGIPHGQLLINAQELFLAGLVLAAEQHPDEALKAWLQNIGFYKRALNDRITLITRSILMVNYGAAQDVLPALLQRHPQLAKTYEAELREALAPFGPKEVNITLTAQMEYKQVEPILEKLGNYSQNKVHRFEQEFIALWQLPPSALPSAFKQFEEKHKRIFTWEDWHSPVAGVVTNLLLGGMAVGGDLALAMHSRDAKSRLLDLYVQMKSVGVAGDQASAFLSQSPPQLFDPFTDRPFAYDAAVGCIHFSPFNGRKTCLRVE